MPTPTPAQVERAGKLVVGCEHVEEVNVSLVGACRDCIAQQLADEADRATKAERERLKMAVTELKPCPNEDWPCGCADAFLAALRAGDAAVSRPGETT